MKLIIGAIFKEEEIIRNAERRLVRHFGTIDYSSRVMPFYHTEYYQKEFGSDLKRKFISFSSLIPPEDLARIKILTNRIERKFSLKNRRLINIDPGYLDLARLILASTKDFMHRIYLGRGIYAETTLFYQNNTFGPREWTYPDYRTADYIEVFNQIRKIYHGQIK